MRRWEGVAWHPLALVSFDSIYRCTSTLLEPDICSHFKTMGVYFVVYFLSLEFVWHDMYNQRGCGFQNSLQAQRGGHRSMWEIHGGGGLFWCNLFQYWIIFWMNTTATILYVTKRSRGSWWESKETRCQPDLRPNFQLVVGHLHTWKHCTWRPSDPFASTRFDFTKIKIAKTAADSGINLICVFCLLQIKLINPAKKIGCAIFSFFARLAATPTSKFWLSLVYHRLGLVGLVGATDWLACSLLQSSAWKTLTADSLKIQVELASTYDLRLNLGVFPPVKTILKF